MPVMVTGAEDALGRAVIEQLRAAGGEVRVFLDATVAGEDDATDLRMRGCKVALGELDDEGRVESALAQVHTLVHCWGGPLQDAEAQIDAAATLCSAALGAGVRRFVWVRHLAPGTVTAGTPAEGTGNRYLDALAEIDALVTTLPLETVVISTGLRYGTGDALTALLGAGAVASDDLDREAVHAPVAIVDVARAVAIADRQRGGGTELHLRLDLLGPEQMPLGEVLRRMGLLAHGTRGGDDMHDGPGADRPADGQPLRRTPVPPWIGGWLSRSAVPVDAGDAEDAVAVNTIARGAERLAAAARA